LFPALDFSPNIKFLFKPSSIQSEMRSESTISNPPWQSSVEADQHQDDQSISSQTEDETPPLHAVNVAPRWNESKTTLWKVTATFWCAFVMGSNDAAYGAIIPYVCTVQNLMQSKTS
jgi:hypothetical protein